jgi:hypothetical protein
MARNGRVHVAPRCLLSGYQQTWQDAVEGPAIAQKRAIPSPPRHQLYPSEGLCPGGRGRPIRPSTPHYPGLRGEGSMPVPLPPPA